MKLRIGCVWHVSIVDKPTKCRNKALFPCRYSFQQNQIIVVFPIGEPQTRVVFNREWVLFKAKPQTLGCGLAFSKKGVIKSTRIPQFVRDSNFIHHYLKNHVVMLWKGGWVDISGQAWSYPQLSTQLAFASPSYFGR